METILITGGVGFIGSELCRQLTAAGKKVRVLDLRKPTEPLPGVEYVQGDVRNFDSVIKSLDEVTKIVHFAAIVSVALCQDDPVGSEQTNLIGTSTVLDAARFYGSKSGKMPRVIFASSAAVYGKLGDHEKALAESDTLSAPLSFYAAQKLSSEQRLQLFTLHFGIPTLSFRFFNVFGKGQDPKSPYSGVISIFLERIRRNETLLLNGKGNQTRDFIHVSDIAAACKAALGADSSHFTGQAINLGSGTRLTITELAAEMQKIAGKNSNTAFGPARQGDVQHSLANISKAKSLLNWKPQVSLSEGLKELLQQC